MLRKRLIFSLIHSNGFFLQSRNFRGQKVGNMKWLEKNYKFQDIAWSIDELVILDATRDGRSIRQFSELVSGLVKGVFVPVTAGGGIRTKADAETLFRCGADKIILNTALYKDTKLVEQLVNTYGSQSVVASVDFKKEKDGLTVYIENGEEPIPTNLQDYFRYVQDLGVGEIYFNSIDRDGTGFGYELDVIDEIKQDLSIPLIVAGGAGNEKHLEEVLARDNISAAATANLFNFVGDGLLKAREAMHKSGINLARWK